MKRSRLLSILLAMTMVFTMIPAGMMAEPDDVAEAPAIENNEGSAPEENPAPAEESKPAEEPPKDESANAENPAPADEPDKEENPAPAENPAQPEESEGGNENPAPAAEPEEEPGEEGEPEGELPAEGEEPAPADDEPEGEEEGEPGEEIPEFVIEDDKLVKYNGEAEELMIPDGIKVIGSKAFYENKTIKKVVLPDSVEEIAASAFEKCSNLEKVTIGANSKLAKIGANAFADDKKLDTSFAADVEDVDDTAFYKAEEPAEGTEPEGEPSGEEPAGEEPAAPAEENVPGDVTDEPEEEPEEPTPEFEISGEKLVKYNWEEGVVSIPDGITVIGKQAFKGNKSITKVILPDSVETISTSAFENCTNLEQVVIGANSKLSRIDWAAFKNDAKLDTSFAANVKTVAGNAFVEKEEDEPEPEEEAGEEEAAPEEEAGEEEPAEEPETTVIVGSGEVEAALQPMNDGPTAPVIDGQPTDQTVPVGTLVSFTVTSANADRFQWQIDRNDGKGFQNQATTSIWKGTTTDTFSFVAIDARAAFTYRVVAINDYGETPSNPVTLTIASGEKPVIDIAPTNQFATSGSLVTFTVTSANADRFQWQIDRHDDKGFQNQATTSIWQGTTTDTFSFVAIASRAAFTYRVVAINDYGETPSDPVTLTLGNAPTIDVQPENKTVATGETVTFTVTASNADRLQWQIDRHDDKGFQDQATTSIWKGTTTDTFSFVAIEARAAFTYRVVAINDFGVTASDPVTLTIASAELPVIDVQPVSQTVASGATVTFTVASANADRFQWQIDRNDGKGFQNQATTSIWKGTTTDTFSFVAIASRAAFTYRVVAINSAGETPSDPVTLTIASGEKPVIDVQPTDQTVASGTTATFTVISANADRFQWQIDRNDGKGFQNQATTSIWKGTTTNTFTFTAIASRAAFAYRVVAINNFGETASNPVTLTIASGEKPVIDVQPTSQTVAPGAAATFTVTSANADRFQWQIDRNDGKGFQNQATTSIWKGTTTDTFSFVAIESRAAFTYRVVAINAAGETASDPVTVTLASGEKPVIDVQPVSKYAVSGGTVTFAVTSANADRFQWQIDRHDDKGFQNQATTSIWQGTTTDTFSFVAIASRAAFTYRVVAINDYGETASNPVTVTLGDAPTIDTAPANQVVAPGETVTFTVASANADRFQWQIDRNDGNGFVDQAETNIWLGTTTDTFSFIAIEARAAFTYRVVAINDYGETASDPVTLTIATGEKPIIDVAPTNQTAVAGETVTFTVTSANADRFQWQIDRNDGKGFVNQAETNIWRGTTSDTFSFVAIEARAAFTYRVVAINLFGETPSDPVTLTIGSPRTTVNNVIYELQGEVMTVVGYEGTFSTYTIEAEVDGHDVTKIGQSAFEGNTNLTSITMPNKITVIDKYAFKNCTNLSSMNTY